MFTPFADSHQHLSRRDPRLKAADQAGWPLHDRARTRTRSHSRVLDHLAADFHQGRRDDQRPRNKALRPRRTKAQKLIQLSDEELRNAGLSVQAASMRSLASFFLDNPATIRGLKKMPDEEVIEALLPIRGVGVWTAQMFLIFCLGRPDVCQRPTSASGPASAMSLAWPRCPRTKS